MLNVIFAKKYYDPIIGNSIKDVNIRYFHVDEDILEKIISDEIPNQCYYSVVRKVDKQKPYFIWTCHPNNMREFLDKLIYAIRLTAKQWMNVHISIDSFHLYEIPNVVEEQSTYHLIINGYYHENGDVAHQFIEDIGLNFQSDIAIINNRRNVDQVKHILYKGLDKREIMYYNINNDCVIMHNRVDHAIAIITHVHGIELKKCEKTYSWYTWFISWFITVE